MLLIVLQENGGSAVSDDLAALAGKAYVHGFPLTFDLHEVGRIAREGLGSLPRVGADRDPRQVPCLSRPGDRLHRSAESSDRDEES